MIFSQLFFMFLFWLTVFALAMWLESRLFPTTPISSNTAKGLEGRKEPLRIDRCAECDKQYSR